MSMLGYVPNMPDPKTYGEQQLEGAGRVLDLPLNTVQGALSYDEPMLTGAWKGMTGQRDYTGLDAFSPEFMAKYPEVAAVGAVMSDLLLDPTMYFGLGTAKQAGKAAATAGKQARGGLLSSAPNYIDNFYGYKEANFLPEGYSQRAVARQMQLDPSKVPVDHKQYFLQREQDLALADQLLAQPKVAAMLKKKAGALPKNDAEKLGLIKKAQGFMDWAVDSAKAVDDMLPLIGKDRAAKDLWRDTGINKNGQKLINKYLDDFEATGDPSALKKAVAQAQYMGHINHQAKREGTIHPALQKIIDMSYVDGYQPFDIKNYKSSVSKQQYLRDGQPVELEDSVVERMFGFAEKAWDKAGDLPKDRSKLTLAVKETTGITGEHTRDALGGNRQNMLSNKLTSVFKDDVDGFSSVTDMKDKAKELGLNVVGRDKGGIYLQSSFHSESYTEGGVNVVTYLKNNGEYYSVISDVHNFLEKIPVVGKAVGTALPQDVIAVTPPIVGNVLNRPAILKTGGKGGSVLQTGGRVSPYSQRISGKNWDSAEVIKDLREIASATPTGEAAKVDMEIGKNLGMLSGYAAYKSDSEE